MNPDTPMPLRATPLLCLLLVPVAMAQQQAPSRSISSYRADLAQLFETRLTQNAQIRQDTWEQTARRMITLTAKAMANDHVDSLDWPIDTARPDELALVADRLLEAGCDDPNLLFCCLRAYERVWRDDDARKLAQRLKTVPASKFAAIIDFALQDELSAMSLDRKDWETIPSRRSQAVWSAARQTGRERRFVDPLLRLSLQMVLLNHARYWNLTGQQTILAKAAELQGVHPWLVAMLKGRNEITDAWRARGNKWAAEVDPAAWPVFDTHLKDAEKYLTAAAENRPSLPEAWTSLITTAMGMGKPLSPFFDSGRAAETDNYPLWSTTRYASLPRWGGSYPQIIELARKGLVGDHYETLAPYRFVETVRAAASDQRTFRLPDSVWSDSKLVDEAIGVINRYIEMAGDSDRGARFLGVLVDVAMECGRYEIAAEAAQRLSRMPLPQNPRALGTLPAVWLSWPQAMASDQRSAIEDAARLLDDEHDPQAARSACQRALTNLPNDHPGRLYVEHLLAAATAEIDFAQGQWVNLTPGENLLGWRADWGDWRWVDGAMQAATGASTFRADGRAHFHGPLELVAKIEIPRPTTDAQAVVGVSLVGKTDTARVGVETMLCPLFGEFQALAMPSTQLQVPGPPQTMLEARIVVSDAGVTVGNGEKTYPLADKPTADALNSTYLQPAIFQMPADNAPRMRIIVRELRIRKLP